MMFASIFLSGVELLVIFRKCSALVIALVFLLSGACSVRQPAALPGVESTHISALVTVDALFELAGAVGGERVDVVNVMPPGAEPHHFEPSARDLALLNSADMLFLCGLGLEPWAEGAVVASGNDRLVVADVSFGIEPIALFEDGFGDRNGSGRVGHGELYDPHIWLSPVCAAAIAGSIRDAFTGVDPDGAEYYRSNCEALVSRLDELYNEFSVKFGVLDNRAIVTGHAVFAYLCRDFGLVQNSIEGVFAEGEPSARELAELVDFCRERGVTTILAESLASPLVAEALAAEAGAVVRFIYTMESAEDGLSYLERMEHNLSVILESL